MTAYSYFFGAIFMGLCSLQYIGTTENRTKFIIPKEVSYIMYFDVIYTSLSQSMFLYMLHLLRQHFVIFLLRGLIHKFLQF